MSKTIIMGIFKAVGFDIKLMPNVMSNGMR